MSEWSLLIGIVTDASLRQWREVAESLLTSTVEWPVLFQDLSALLCSSTSVALFEKNGKLFCGNAPLQWAFPWFCRPKEFELYIEAHVL